LAGRTVDATGFLSPARETRADTGFRCAIGIGTRARRNEPSRHARGTIGNGSYGFDRLNGSDDLSGCAADCPRFCMPPVNPFRDKCTVQSDLGKQRTQGCLCKRLFDR
jgi:hypothetical protein